jgi:hypothetical protein
MHKYLSTCLSIALFLIFLYTLFTNALNVPSFDDYDTTLNFIKRFYFENNLFPEKLKMLFGRHNEHRIFFSKLTAATYYGLFHKINFAHLVLFQNIFLLAFFGLMLAIMRMQKLLFPETVLLASVFLFSLSFWQVTYYYWGGIQHYVVFFFSFLSLFMLNKAVRPAGINFCLAVMAAAVAVFSFGNGFITLLLGAFLLVVQKKWPLLIIWMAISAVLLGVTFFVQPSVDATVHTTFNPEWMARLLFTFLGSFLFVNPPEGQYINIIFCMVVGFAVLGTWVWLFLRGYAFRNPLLYCLLCLPVLTGIIISISRFETKAAGGIAPRYMFFTATIPVILLLIFLDLGILKKYHLKYISAVGLIVWGSVFYNNKSALQQQNKELMTTIKRWEKDRNTPLIYYKDSGTYSEILQWAAGHDVFDIQSSEKSYFNDTNGK